MRLDSYDNADEPSQSDPPDRPMVIDRVYGLDWAAFDDRDWQTLGAIYTALPGWQQAASPMAWFGTSDDTGAHLEASVESPGLHVTGVLECGTFLVWDTAFRGQAGDLPAYDPR
jgi:hypothetical protein